MAKKATKVQVMNRTKEVRELLLQGKTRSFIQQYAAKEFSLSERVIDEYIKKATDEIRENATTDATTDAGILVERLFGMANSSEKGGDLKTASGILMNVAKLKGLDKQSMDVNVEIKREHKETPDEDLDKILGLDEDDDE